MNNMTEDSQTDESKKVKLIGRPERTTCIGQDDISNLKIAIYAMKDGYKDTFIYFLSIT
jgi:hypothetical protein